ncbi:hypothetical protein BJY21_001914 [Kineosphaera limosa]|uniref:DUF4038 domain-containing protein n=1 Tax=Kineosphaera limosa NBRC 100340 TaxID=1184609 RepID=K6WXM2_9MICO|nr:DUF4038 domain-containing protein [Kineosphaera limosa]NYE00730.1 hypothetical protein [Kineosphaera limosa]GAB96817.1 hypothetical protein KILIM_049_00350 [Kineosphaera limosa NBRC 100340]
MLRRALLTSTLVTALALSGACTSVADDAAGTHTSGDAMTSDAAQAPAQATTSGPPTAISSDRRGLQAADGTPFVWVADTAWMLTQKLTRSQIEQYLDTRVEQGFTVVQMVAVAGRDGTFGHTANAQGDLPYDGDFGHLRATGTYWDHVDFAIKAAQQRGLTVALLPAWSVAHAGVTLRDDNARGYGRFLAQRLRTAGAAPVVWVMGGDDTNPHTAVWRELLAGVRETGDRGLVSYHPAGWHTSLGQVDGADFEMVQTSHCQGVRDGYPSLLAQTRSQAPDRPVVDAEPLYEDHPWCWDSSQGYSTTQQVRAQLWWSVFGGGFGATYGHHSVWQFYDGSSPINSPQPTWSQALSAPVAQQVRHLRTYLESVKGLGMAPDDAALTAGQGEGWSRAVALRSASGDRVSVYLPTPRSLDVDGARLEGARFAVTWFNPRTGATVEGPARARNDLAGLRPPPSGDGDDWVVTIRRLA